MTRPRLLLGAVTVALLVPAFGAAANGADAGFAIPGPAASPSDVRPESPPPTGESTAPTSTSESATTTPPGTSTATITIHDQVVRANAGNETVVVASVHLPEGGFVSLRNEYGVVLGHTGYIEPGRHENVTVTVNESLEPGQVVVAVALRDSARGTETANREYDVVETGSEEDNPYFVNGELVADSASVTGTTNATTTTLARTSNRPLPSSVG